MKLLHFKNEIDRHLTYHWSSDKCSYEIGCGLFNDAVNRSDRISLVLCMNNKLEIMWSDAVVAPFKLVTYHLPKGLRKNTKNSG